MTHCSCISLRVSA